MKRKLLLIFWIQLNLLFCALANNDQEVHFHRIISDQEINISNTWSIFQDHLGFMWFGTEDGLVRYDGYDAIVFRHNTKDSLSISNNTILALFEDHNKHLWIGTAGGGLNRYNREENNFSSWRNIESKENSLPSNHISCMIESCDSVLWIGTEGGGIAKLDLKVNYDHAEFEVYNTTSESIKLSSDYIRSLDEDSHGNIYVGTLDGGINMITSNRDSIYWIQEIVQSKGLSDNNVKVFVDSSDRIWVATFGEGLDLFLPQKKEFIHYNVGDKTHFLKNGEIETIIEDWEGKIWIGTDGGLSEMLDFANPVPENRFRTYLHEPLDEESLSSNSVKSLYVNRQEQLWVSSYAGGIQIFDPTIYKFQTIRNQLWKKRSLSHNNITSIIEDESGRIWIGTDGGGLNLLNKGLDNIYTNDYRYIPIKDRITDKESVMIQSMDMDSLGNLWIGFWEGHLVKFNTKTEAVTFYSLHEENQLSQTSTSIVRPVSINADEEDYLWIGTFSHGIIRLHIQSGDFEKYYYDPFNPQPIAGERTNAILLDIDGNIWAGAERTGLKVLRPNSNKFESVTDGAILNSETAVTSLTLGNKGDILIGTISSGLLRYNPELKKVISLSEFYNLPHVRINSITFDENENIWLGSTDGLIVVYPSDTSFSNFTKKDGLQGNQFNIGSAQSFSNGMIGFGGTNGWNPINPTTIKANYKKSNIVFTNFWIDGLLMNVGVAGSPLKNDINIDNHIYLNHRQNSLSYQFALLDYHVDNRVHYEYHLDGFHPNWFRAGVERKASFTNLNPGEYILQVRVKYNNQSYSDTAELLITISPAWWQTIHFKILIVIFLLGSAYSLYRIRIHQLVQQKIKLEKIVQKRTLELKGANIELREKNDEILAQNEELQAQNEQIVDQRDQLSLIKNKLQKLNESLEEKVDKRTKKLKKTIARLDKALFELDKFVYSASHDLSAPLKSILGLIRLAELERDPDNIQTCLDHMKYSIQNLELVIKNLTNYARNEHSKVEVKAIDCSQLIEEQIRELSYLPNYKFIEFKRERSNGEMIFSDPIRLRIIFQNIIGNAIKYADLEKKPPFVHITCISTPEQWGVHIEDNGVGIEREHLDRIFHMYYRANELSDGSGLGLFIVKESVEKLGGEISVKSMAGIGTTFKIIFPK